MFPPLTRSDARQGAWQAHAMSLSAEDGRRFAKDADHWRCVEYTGLLILPGPERYRVGERIFGSLGEALRHLEAGSRVLADEASCDGPSWG